MRVESYLSQIMVSSIAKKILLTRLLETMEKKDLKRSYVQYLNGKDTQDLYEDYEKQQSKVSKVELTSKILKNISQSNNTDNSADAANIKVQCEHCSAFGEDNRNEYFAKLLQEELKYVNRCMRSRVYVKILNFLNATKQYHIQDFEETDTEKM